jgi:chromosome segregation ATPase
MSTDNVEEDHPFEDTTRLPDSDNLDQRNTDNAKAYTTEGAIAEEDQGYDDSSFNYLETIHARNTEIKTVKHRNTSLRDDLKRLSEDLTKRLEKLRVRTSKKTAPVKNHEKVLSKEIDITEKQIALYQKDLNSLKEKVEYGSEIQRNFLLPLKTQNLTFY